MIYLKFTIVSATYLAGLCAYWNLADEYRMFQTFPILYLYTFAWMVFPGIACVVGLAAKDPARVRACLFVAVFVLWFYYRYAANGSTSIRDGAQHMHVGLVPMLMGPVVIAVYGTARAAERGVKRLMGGANPSMGEE